MESLLGGGGGGRRWMGAKYATCMLNANAQYFKDFFFFFFNPPADGGK